MANQTAADVLGVALTELVGCHASQFVTDRRTAESGFEALVDSRLETYAARRVVTEPNGSTLAICVKTKVLGVSGRRLAASMLVREDDLDPLSLRRFFASTVPACVGLADKTWRIAAISDDVYDVLGRRPDGCVGTNLLEWLDPDVVRELREMRAERIEPRAVSKISVASVDGVPAEMAVLLRETRAGGEPAVEFALVGSFEDHLSALRDRIAELEMHLRRIGVHVRSSGCWLRIDSLPVAGGHPQIADLTTRQQEILARIAQGERVATIARALFITPSTVRNHLHVIFRRLGVHSQAELIEEVRRREVAPSGVDLAITNEEPGFAEAVVQAGDSRPRPFGSAWFLRRSG